MTAHENPSATSVLQDQLDLIWSFAEGHVLPRITLELATWEPSSNVVNVRRGREGWVADWPDESAQPMAQPLAEPTVGWLLWHIEWWWGNAARATRGEPAVGPETVTWTGSVDGVRAARTTWGELLDETPPGAVVRGLMPQNATFATVAGWVNFELAKNLSEIGQLVLRHANRPR